MIDFRYHLVSLISVFLALAVGIILGAGPLQGAIGQQLTDQVDALRTERNTLREEVEDARATASDQREFIDAAGEQLVAGSLAGQRVAVVEVDDVADDDVSTVLDELDHAGAQVSAQESLTDSWTSAEDASVRETVSGGLRDQLGQEAFDDEVNDVIDEDSDSAELLAAALTLSLTDADPADPTARSGEARELQQLLERMGLVEVTTAPDAPADAVLLLSGGGEAPPEDGTEDADPETSGVAALATLAGTASDLATSVVAGPTMADGDLIAAIRSDDELVERVTTVSGIEARAGQVVVPLAIAAREDGVVDQYGFEEDATVLPPAPDGSADGGSGAARSNGQGS